MHNAPYTMHHAMLQMQRFKIQQCKIDNMLTARAQSKKIYRWNSTQSERKAQSAKQKQYMLYVHEERYAVLLFML